MHIYIYTHTYIHTYIYIYIYREREKVWSRAAPPEAPRRFVVAGAWGHRVRAAKSVCIHMYIYIYIEREIYRVRAASKMGGIPQEAPTAETTAWHCTL